MNRVVDAANVWSVEALCPVGLYDARKVAGELELRFGTDGEGYEGIRKDWVNVAGRPVLVDGGGPFGNPTSDSARACVTEATSRLLAVAFLPLSFEESEVAGLERELRETQTL